MKRKSAAWSISQILIGISLSTLLAAPILVAGPQVAYASEHAKSVVVFADPDRLCPDRDRSFDRSPFSGPLPARPALSGSL